MHSWQPNTGSARFSRCARPIEAPAKSSDARQSLGYTEPRCTRTNEDTTNAPISTAATTPGEKYSEKSSLVTIP